MRKVSQRKHDRVQVLVGFLERQQEDTLVKRLLEDARIWREAQAWADGVTGWDRLERQFFGIELCRLGKNAFAIRNFKIGGE